MTYDELIILTDTLADDLVPMPTLADDVCPTCHTAKDEQYAYCYSCTKVNDAIGFPCPHVIPISFYMTPADDEPPSPLRERMHDYKESDDPAAAQRAARDVGAILTRYLLEHGDALRRRLGAWDSLVAVPSKKHLGPPPLATALEPFGDLVGHVTPMLAAGPDPIGRSAPSADGFATTRDVTERRVLLIDDTFTTGATLHSAAATLTDAGATILAGVVIARKINPDPRWANTQAVWDRQSRTRFSFSGEPFWYTELLS